MARTGGKISMIMTTRRFGHLTLMIYQYIRDSLIEEVEVRVAAEGQGVEVRVKVRDETTQIFRRMFLIETGHSVTGIEVLIIKMKILQTMKKTLDQTKILNIGVGGTEIFMKTLKIIEVQSQMSIEEVFKIIEIEIGAVMVEIGIIMEIEIIIVEIGIIMETGIIMVEIEITIRIKEMTI